MKPCDHTPPNPTCRLCWLYEHDPRYRQLWGGDPAAVTPARAPSPEPPRPSPEQLEKLGKIKGVIRRPCLSLGQALEERASCGCGGTAALLHACHVHGRCRPYSPRQGLPDRLCVDCPEYRPS